MTRAELFDGTMEEKPYLTVEQAAKLLQISTKTCYDWIHIDGFPCVMIGNIRRIPRGLLLDWMNEQARKGCNG